MLIHSIPMALCRTERVCSSVNLASTKTGINMDAVKLMGEILLELAEQSKDRDSADCMKLVVFCNAPDDNPFMAGWWHRRHPDFLISRLVSWICLWRRHRRSAIPWRTFSARSDLSMREHRERLRRSPC